MAALALTGLETIVWSGVKEGGSIQLLCYFTSMRKLTVVAVVEPPDQDDPYWVVEAPAIHYQAQGRTRREALARFEEGLLEAVEWALENGARIDKQPEIVEYVL